MNPEFRHLLDGYATGTLTAAERERLFSAALEDQALFDALAEEQSLKDLLDDPEARGYLLAELDRQKPQAAPLVTPPRATRYWMPLTAVMLGLVITGSVWWRNQPPPSVEIATVQAPPPAPVSLNSEVRVSPATQRVPPSPGEKRPVLREEAPASPPVLDTFSSKKEADAIQAPKATTTFADKVVAETSSADAAAAPASVLSPALSAAGNLQARPAYQLLRFKNGQFLPVDPTFRFVAGDILALQVHFQSNPPQVTFADRPALALTREGNWYRTETVTLASGQQDFVITPSAPPPARSRMAAPAGGEARADSGPWEVLRIRLQVP